MLVVLGIDCSTLMGLLAGLTIRFEISKILTTTGPNSGSLDSALIECHIFNSLLNDSLNTEIQPALCISSGFEFSETLCIYDAS